MNPEEKNNATQATGGNQSLQIYVSDGIDHTPLSKQNQQKNVLDLTLENQARDFMLQHEIKFEGEFLETGNIPIQFVGYMSNSEKLSQSRNKSERLFCQYLDDDPCRPGLRITFRSSHHLQVLARLMGR